VKVDVTQRNQNPAALLPEKCEPEVPNNFRERSLKKELGGETKDTEGDDDHKKKENYSAEFRHGSITPCHRLGTLVGRVRWRAAGRLRRLLSRGRGFPNRTKIGRIGIANAVFLENFTGGVKQLGAVKHHGFVGQHA
jgi:hypothetical protein